MIIEEKTQDTKLPKILEEINNYLTKLCIYFHSGKLPFELNAFLRKRFKLNALNYCMRDYGFFRKNYDGMLLRCIYPKKILNILKEFHFDFSRGYYSRYTITVKNL